LLSTQGEPVPQVGYDVTVRSNHRGVPGAPSPPGERKNNEDRGGNSYVRCVPSPLDLLTKLGVLAETWATRAQMFGPV